MPPDPNRSFFLDLIERRTDIDDRLLISAGLVRMEEMVVFPSSSERLTALQMMSLR